MFVVTIKQIDYQTFVYIKLIVYPFFYRLLLIVCLSMSPDNPILIFLGEQTLAFSLFLLRFIKKIKENATIR